MSTKNTGITSGSLLMTLLLVAFIVLKLCKVIKWSWLWVLGPAWIPSCLIIIGAIFYIRHKIKTDGNSQEIKKPPVSKLQQRIEEMQESKKNAEALKSRQQ